MADFSRRRPRHKAKWIYSHTNEPTSRWLSTPNREREWRIEGRGMKKTYIYIATRGSGEKIEINVSGLVPIPSYMRSTQQILLFIFGFCAAAAMPSSSTLAHRIRTYKCKGDREWECEMATATATTSDHQSRNDYDLLVGFFVPRQNMQ